MQCGEHKVTRKGCIHGRLRGLQITDFPEENDVRVVAKDRPEARREGVVMLSASIWLPGQCPLSSYSIGSSSVMMLRCVPTTVLRSA